MPRGRQKGSKVLLINGKRTVITGYNLPIPEAPKREYRRWTDAEVKQALQIIHADPDNLRHCFRTIALEQNRTWNSVQQAYYNPKSGAIRRHLNVNDEYRQMFGIHNHTFKGMMKNYFLSYLSVVKRIRQFFGWQVKNNIPKGSRTLMLIRERDGNND